MALTPATIYSVLGNSNSLVPLAVKDIAATAGMTAGSFITGKEEGIDRFIDETGTEVIWLFGIPAFKWLFDKTVFKAMGMDAKFDARNLKDKDVFEKIKQHAPTEDIKNGMQKIASKQKLFRGAATAKFFISTALTVLTYFGLTKFKHKYTENKIRENLIAEYNEKKAKEQMMQQEQEQQKANADVTFKGIGSAVESLAFSPVKNMWVLDGSIAAERLSNSRTPQEFSGYAIKEAATFSFMYLIGGYIQEGMEKLAKNKHNKSIELDARVLEGEAIKEAFKSGSVEKSLEAFEKANTSNANLYEFLNKNPENFVVKMAKQSDVIKKYKKTDKIDTRKYIDLKEVQGVKDKIKELYSQYKEALAKGETPEKFFAGVKKLKRNSIIANMAICIGFLGIITPALMLLQRKANGQDDMEFQTKKEIREQLIKEGVIA